MRLSSARRNLWLGISLLLLATPALAQSSSQKTSSPKNPAQKQEPLAEDENPEMIGKRNINKLQINFYSFDKEVALGRQFAQEVDRSAKLVEDPIIVEYINKVGQNLVLHSDAKVPFTIKVIDTDEINAFALPGGFFYVNKGLILAADNEAELAGPMAHEIAHVCARHGVEQASKGQIVNWASLPLIFMGGWGGFAVQQAASLAIPMGFLKFSRNAEYEADRLGVQYLWATGYDPHSMSTFFEKLQAQEKKKPGTMARIFSTHPMVGDRIDKVNALIARFPERSEYTINTSEFQTVKGRLIAFTNARGTGGRGGASDADNKRPTLKKRQPGAPEGSDPNATGGEGTTERPTLRKKDGEAPAPKTDSSSKPIKN
ncbi:MAG TPA: M48 family metallopeptidase [Blastocatellia bacterium]|nr:M48 family metallopeptidase [Blastocatellia bacterium]